MIEKIGKDDAGGGPVSTLLKTRFRSRRISRVQFFVPPDADKQQFNPNTARLGRYSNYPPYGVGVVASLLRGAGLIVDIVNLNDIVLRECRGDSSFEYDDVVRKSVTEALERFRPDLIGATCMFSLSHSSTRDLCALLHQLNPDTPITLGGVHITNGIAQKSTRDMLVEHFWMVDAFFIYEAELAFRDFCLIVNGDLSQSELSQVLLRCGDELLLIDKLRRPSENDLDVIPALDLMRVGELSENGKIGAFHYLKPEGARLSTILSNRGCRAQCTFCSVRNFNGVGVRMRSIQSVIDELLLMRQDHGVSHIMWLDDDLLYNTKRVLALFNEMVRQNVNLTWDCSNGVIAASCTEEIIAAAAESGCIGLNIGMESGSPRILRSVKKPGTVKNFLEAAEVLRRHPSIQSRVFLMIGFPGETFEDISQTIHVSREMALDWYATSPLQPLPNTPIYDQMVDQGLIGNLSFNNIRYAGGPHGKISQNSEGAGEVMLTDFDRLMMESDPSAVPTHEDLEVIWAYMNYHLNFARLTSEQRPIKLQQALRLLNYIADSVAPNDPIAHYYRSVVYRRVHGHVSEELTQRLLGLLGESEDWQSKFEVLGLSATSI